MFFRRQAKWRKYDQDHGGYDFFDRLKLDTEKEIAVMIAEKAKARLMEVIPFFIILYIGLTNQGFFDPLYHNLSGIFIMSAARRLPPVIHDDRENHCNPEV